MCILIQTDLHGSKETSGIIREEKVGEVWVLLIVKEFRGNRERLKKIHLMGNLKLSGMFRENIKVRELVCIPEISREIGGNMGN